MASSLGHTAAAIALVAAVAGCGRSVPDAPDRPANVSVVAGEIGDVYSPRVFFVAATPVASSEPIELAPGDFAIATGEMQKVTIVELERSWKVDLDPEDELSLVAKPILVAGSVLVMSGSSEPEIQARNL